MRNGLFVLANAVRCVDGCVQRAIADQTCQLPVHRLNFLARRLAYPVNEPEPMQAKAAIEEVSRGDGRKLPTLHGVADNWAASLERLGERRHNASAYVVENEAELLSL